LEKKMATSAKGKWGERQRENIVEEKLRAFLMGRKSEEGGRR